MLEIITALGRQLDAALLLVPLGIVLWEAVHLRAWGQMHNWKRMGIGFYLSGYTLFLAGVASVNPDDDALVLGLLLLIVIIGAGAPILHGFLKEDDAGQLSHRRVVTTRFLGVTVYGFCAFVVWNLRL